MTGRATILLAVLAAVFVSAAIITTIIIIVVIIVIVIWCAIFTTAAIPVARSPYAELFAYNRPVETVHTCTYAKPYADFYNNTPIPNTKNIFVWDDEETCNCPFFFLLFFPLSAVLVGFFCALSAVLYSFSRETLFIIQSSIFYIYIYVLYDIILTYFVIYFSYFVFMQFFFFLLISFFSYIMI